MMGVAVDGVQLCIANTAECGIRAISNICTHEEEDLSEGYLLGNDVVCQAHGSRFSLVDGHVTGRPATVPVEVFEVVVDEGNVYVDL